MYYWCFAFCGRLRIIMIVLAMRLLIAGGIEVGREGYDCQVGWRCFRVGVLLGVIVRTETNLITFKDSGYYSLPISLFCSPLRLLYARTTDNSLNFCTERENTSWLPAKDCVGSTLHFVFPKGLKHASFLILSQSSSSLYFAHQWAIVPATPLLFSAWYGLSSFA